MSDEAKNSGFLTRVQHAVRSTTRRADEARSGLVEKVRERVEESLAPAIEDAAKKLVLKLAEPENAQRLQETLAGFAQFAMKSGFRSDPNARLLFEFVDGLEKRHSREEVLRVVVQHAMVYEQDLLAMLLEAVQNGRDPAAMGAGGFEGFRDRASTRLLTLLCSLAALESDEPAPTAAQSGDASASDKQQARDEQIAYFERAPIDDRFKPLARMAAGEKEGFARAEHSSPTPEKQAETGDRPMQPQPAPASSSGLVRRTLDRLSGERTSALAKLMPSLSDPQTRFLTTSYLFFMQSYLVRAMIEELPEILGTVKDLEREMEGESEDVIEIGD